jgi:transmembrane sensor
MTAGSFRELGRLIAAEQDERLADETLDEVVRRGLAKRVGAPSPRRRLGWTAVAIGVGALAVTLASVLVSSRTEGPGPAPLAYFVGADARPGELRAWVSASAEADLPLRFSDGSRVVLESGARGRVVATTALGADIVLEEGSAAVDIVHRTGAAWSLRSGPFVVHVTGTRFSVEWKAATDTLKVELVEGGVTIEGCSLGRGQPLRAGQRLEATCREGRVAIGPLANEAAGPISSVERLPETLPSTHAAPRAEQGVPASEGGERPLATRGSPQGVAEPRVSAPRWQSLARDGRFAEAYRLAVARGLDEQLGSLESADLVLLGDAARLSGETGVARRAYGEARHRFAGGEAASRAAFHLGRLDSLAGQHVSASRWYESYLAEAPGGPLAAAALGRLLEARLKAGDVSEAKNVAARYLSRYPEGPHADDARNVLGATPAP